MPIDELAGGLFKLIARAVMFIALEIFWETICYWIGKFTLRILTLGKYPPNDDEAHCVGCVHFFGMIVIFVFIIGIAQLASSAST